MKKNEMVKFSSVNVANVMWAACKLYLTRGARMQGLPWFPTCSSLVNVRTFFVDAFCHVYMNIFLPSLPSLSQPFGKEQVSMCSLPLVSKLTMPG